MDEESQKVILYGGNMDEDCNARVSVNYNDTWAWDLNSRTWEQMQPELSPIGSYFSNMAYDSESDRIILFGGVDKSVSVIGETWAYDYNTDTWQQLSSGPAPRWGANLVYDPVSDKIVLFGGIADTCFTGRPEMYDDTWIYDYNTDTWTEQFPDDHPPKNGGFLFTYSTKEKGMITFGGIGTGLNADVWAYDSSLNEWSKVGRISGGPDYRSQMVYDSESDRFITILFLNQNYNMVYDLNTDYLDTRHDLSTGSKFPILRYNNAVIYIEDLDRVFYYGGFNQDGSPASDAWLYDLNSNIWEMVSP